jgi:hypothetical protein
MDKAIAKIVKKGDQWCVVSEDGTKNLGCSKTREGAVKRLQQVEYFKHTKGNEMNYEQAFRNLAKSLNAGDMSPEQIGQAPESRPRQVHVPSDSITEGFSSGSIAGQQSKRLLDKKDHFPVFTETQARSSLSRAWQLSEVPVWYGGNMDDLRREVFEGIAKAHPALVADLNVNVPASRIVALSDGETPSEIKTSKIKDPNDVQKSLVPGTKRPTITTAEVAKACETDTVRLAVAGELMKIIEQQETDLQHAKKLASTLMKKGVSPEQFESLHTYLQSDVLRELIYQEKSNASASNEDRRRALLDRLKPEQKND